MTAFTQSVAYRPSCKDAGHICVMLPILSWMDVICRSTRASRTMLGMGSSTTRHPTYHWDSPLCSGSTHQGQRRFPHGSIGLMPGSSEGSSASLPKNTMGSRSMLLLVLDAPRLAPRFSSYSHYSNGSR